MQKQGDEIAVFSFTRRGTELNRRICGTLAETGRRCRGYAVMKYAGGEIMPLPDHAVEWIGERWGKCAFVFIGAVGIAVRYIAPWIKDKFTDSPVVVMDEKGDYVIPILSGHVGGAAALADELARMTGGVPIHTTATDVNGKFAVDVFAVENRLYITDREAARAISAAVLEGEKIGFCAVSRIHGRRISICGTVPEGIVLCDRPEDLESFRFAVLVAEGWNAEEEQIFANRADGAFLVLRTRNVTAGIGCRRGTEMNDLESGLFDVLAQNGLILEQVEALASVDLKKDEKGILALSRKYGIPFITYPAKELKTVCDVTLRSEFVEQTVGVDNVCERAARLCCQEGSLIQGKCIRRGMTAALSVRQMILKFF